MKRFVMLGLGRFGTAVARRLKKNGCRVAGVDHRRENVEALRDELYEAVIGDVTERETLEALGLDDCDAVVISVGGDITTSLLATLHTKELGAKQVIVKGVTPDHGKILTQLGVDRVVFPKIEVGIQIADGLTWPNMVDFLPIDETYSVVEMAVPRCLVGETLRGADLRRKYGVYVLGIKDRSSGKLDVLPASDFPLEVDQYMLVVGTQDQLHQLGELK